MAAADFRRAHMFRQTHPNDAHCPQAFLYLQDRPVQESISVGYCTAQSSWHAKPQEADSRRASDTTTAVGVGVRTGSAGPTAASRRCSQHHLGACCPGRCLGRPGWGRQADGGRCFETFASASHLCARASMASFRAALSVRAAAVLLLLLIEANSCAAQTSPCADKLASKKWQEGCMGKCRSTRFASQVSADVGSCQASLSGSTLGANHHRPGLAAGPWGARQGQLHLYSLQTSP